MREGISCASKKFNENSLILDKYDHQFRIRKFEYVKLLSSLNRPDAKTDISNNYVSKPVHIKIPIFNGHYLQWKRFKDLYNNVVHNNKAYTEAEKLTILNSKLKGEALNSISGYIKSSQYYNAWNSLCKKYYK